MKYFRIFMGFILIVTYILFLPIPTAACTCEEPLSAKRELNQSTAVFRGEVIDIRDAEDHAHGLKVLFKVSESWKGINESEVTIRTARDGAACGFTFQFGKEYLVYSFTNDAFDNDNLMTGICNRTSQLVMQQAQEDMEVLGQGVAPGISSKHDGQTKFARIGLWIGLGTFVLIIFLVLRHFKRKTT